MNATDRQATELGKNISQTVDVARLRNLLNSWLKQRQSLIVQFNHLCQWRPFTQTHDEASLKNALLSFCQTLLDYVSVGQFQMFETLLCNVDSKSPLDPLKETALAALHFSDQYAGAFDIQTLEEDLGRLGEQLAYRFDLEDDLIRLYPFSPIQQAPL